MLSGNASAKQRRYEYSVGTLGSIGTLGSGPDVPIDPNVPLRQLFIREFKCELVRLLCARSKLWTRIALLSY